MILVRWAVLAFSMWIATLVVPGITVHGGVGTYLWVALLFSGLYRDFWPFSLCGKCRNVVTYCAMEFKVGYNWFLVSALCFTDH